ncbi:hypothetical protein [Vibrio sp. Hal054]|uniref:hypothetical protein n=1 Tax=Vibrio sp. Hal054 TaxID=3035158 RepID=UPI00301BCDD0
MATTVPLSDEELRFLETLETLISDSSYLGEVEEVDNLALDGDHDGEKTSE